MIAAAGLRLQGGSGIDILTTDKAGNTQGISFVTGASTGGFSGSISIGTGEAGASSSGSIEFTTGAGTAGGASSGDIIFTAASPDTGGTQGSLVVDTRQIVPPVITTGTTVITATVATPITYVLDVPDGANATLTFALPYSIELYDIVLIKTEGPGIAGNTITIRTAALVALSDAMPCDVSDGVIVRPVNVAASRATLTGTSIRVERIRVGNSSGCRLYLTGVRR
jgi:hypothetical protein